MATIANAVKGLDELKRKLSELGPKAERKVLRAAWRKGANTYRDEARALAPVESGQLKKKIVTYNARGKRGEIKFKVIASARAEPSPKSPQGYPYSAAVELGHGFPGTRQRLHGTSRAEFLRQTEFGTSQVPPHPFMRPAWENTKDRIVDKFAEEAGKGIEKVASENA